MNKLTSIEIQHILKYLPTRKEYERILQINKKYTRAFNQLSFNPIPMRNARNLFSNVKTQHLYTKKDFKFSGFEKYVIEYDVNYQRYLKEQENKKTECKYVIYNSEERLKYGVNPPKGISKIGKSCYESCADIINFTIPKQIIQLDECSFKNCLKLTSVTLSPSITTIPYQCFFDCPQLKEVYLPSTVTSLDHNCFEKCTSLSKIDLPNHLQVIGHCCFWDCASLTSLTIPSSVILIGDFCFCRCDSLTEIRYSSQLHISNYTFYEFTGNKIEQ